MALSSQATSRNQSQAVQFHSNFCHVDDKVVAYGGELEFDSGEETLETATTSKEGNRRAN